jgi:hypothetical protein
MLAQRRRERALHRPELGALSPLQTMYRLPSPQQRRPLPRHSLRPQPEVYTARRRLAAVFAAVSAEIVDGFGSTLTQAGATPSDPQQPVRRELMRKVIALDPVISPAPTR